MDSVGHFPEGRWEFDESVTACFEDMLTRSIPDLAGMRRLVSQLTFDAISARPFGAGGEGATVVDLGTSKGGALLSVRKLLPEAALVGVEVSEPMLLAAKEAFEGDGLAEIRRLDLRTDYPGEGADVTLAILALQFIPIEYRLQIVQKAFDRTNEGGTLIVVEKVIGGSAALDRTMVDLYLAGKRGAGYPQESVDRKRLALEGVLVPVTAKWNEEILRLSGFREVDCFWRWLNFAGWIARK